MFFYIRLLLASPTLTSCEESSASHKVPFVKSRKKGISCHISYRHIVSDDPDTHSLLLYLEIYLARYLHLKNPENRLDISPCYHHSTTTNFGSILYNQPSISSQHHLLPHNTANMGIANSINDLPADSYLFKNPCSARNITWHYMHSRGNLGQPYISCPNTQKFLRQHCCRDGECHPV